MRNLIRENIVTAGDYLHIDWFPVRTVNRSRKAKAKPSTEVQKALNRKNAAKKLTYLIEENFGNNDYIVTLSYPSDFPYDVAASCKVFKNFIRALSRQFKKENEELKYIYSNEIGLKNGRPHHHLIVSGALGKRIIEDKWNQRFNKKKNYAKCDKLVFAREGLRDLAFYITKDPALTYRSYTCSKNLRKPDTKTRDGKVSGRKLKEMRQDIYNAEEFERLYPGYEFVDASTKLEYEIDYNGEATEIDFPYLSILMFRRDSKYIDRNKQRA